MKFILKILSILLFCISCTEAPNTTPEEADAKLVAEYKVKEIVLDGKWAKNNEEYSGLTWFNNYLVLLPQYPLENDSVGYLPIILESRLIDYINGSNTQPIKPKQLMLKGSKLSQYTSKGSGFEAVAFEGTNVYFSVEANNLLQTFAYLLKGKIDTSNFEITIDNRFRGKVESNSGIDNHSEEAIGIWNNLIFTIHESNGKNLVQNPTSHLFSTDIKFLKTIPFPHIEYRITDITTPNSEGMFWAINYFWPGDFDKQNPAEDSLVINYGIGESHKRNSTVERLVKLNINNDAVNLVDTPPLMLQLLGDNNSRNWEGIAVLKNKGFILITDEFPRTILGFIPFANP